MEAFLLMALIVLVDAGRAYRARLNEASASWVRKHEPMSRIAQQLAIWVSALLLDQMEVYPHVIGVACMNALPKLLHARVSELVSV